jgi:hypothetical protein
MVTVVILLVIGALALYLTILFKKSDAPPMEQNSDTDNSDNTHLREAQRTLTTAMGVCREQHRNAFDALLWLAASDGTISKQETRNLLRFCERHGTTLPDSTYDALEHLNSGVHISFQSSLSEALTDLAALAEKPIQYRAAFIGAAHAICGGNKRISKAKQDFLDRANTLVEEPKPAI